MIVPTIASLISLPTTGFSDGDGVYVQSIEAPWTLARSGSSLSIDGITIVQTLDDGYARWVRDLNYASGLWLNQNSWTINGITGNDENPGTSTLPLASLSEFSRRLGPFPLLKQDTTVTCRTNTLENQPLNLHASLAQGVRLSFKGTATVADQSGVLQTVSPANPNVSTEFSVAGNTDISTLVNDRIQIQGGVRDGLLSWIQRGNGVNKAFTSNWATPIIALNNCPVQNPQVGDSYQAQKLTQMYLGDFVITSANGLNSGFTHFSQVDFSDFDFPLGNLYSTLTLSTAPSGCNFIFAGCRFDGILSFQGTTLNIGTFQFFNCCFTSAPTCGSGYIYFTTGLLNSGAYNDLQVLSGTTACFTHDFAVYGGGVSVLPGGVAQVTGLAVFDAVATPRYPRNVDGSGLFVAPGGVCLGTSFTGYEQFWGSRNAGYGLHVEPGGICSMDSAMLLSVTGNTGKILGTVIYRK